MKQFTTCVAMFFAACGMTGVLVLAMTTVGLRPTLAKQPASPAAASAPSELVLGPSTFVDDAREQQ